MSTKTPFFLEKENSPPKENKNFASLRSQSNDIIHIHSNENENPPNSLKKNLKQQKKSSQMK